MFPAAFEYVQAHSVDEALAALLEHGADARILAGGQSLIPAMRFRLRSSDGSRRYHRDSRSRVRA